MSAKREKRLRRLEEKVEALEKIAAMPAHTISTASDQETTMDATKPRKSLFKRLLEFLKKE